MFREEASAETYSPWTVVHLVFDHLAQLGLHPTLGESGDPGEAAATLLRALGITPTTATDSRSAESMRAELAELRARVFQPPND